MDYNKSKGTGRKTILQEAKMRKFYNHMLSYIPDFYTRKERGATMVEYAILVALISIAAIAVILTVGEQVESAFNRVAAQLQ